MKILIVDDSKGSRDVLRFLVVQKKDDAEVFEAANGIDALEVLKKNEIDIMITDIKMPQMDGLELIEKARVFSPKLQIIVFSAFGNFEFAKKALQFGVTNYLLKPINSDEFYKTLAAVSKKHSENQNSLIWQQFDNCLQAGCTECGTLPEPLSDYSAVITIYINEQFHSQAADFIGQNIDRCLIRNDKDCLLVLARKDGENKTVFDGELYRKICEISPCSVYCAEFENDTVSLNVAHKSVSVQRKEDVFWGHTSRLYRVSEQSQEQGDITPLFGLARRIGRGISEQNTNTNADIEHLIGVMTAQGVTSKQCKYIFFEIIKQFLGGTSSPFYYEQAIEDITSSSTISEVKQRFALMISLVTEPESQEQGGEISTVTRTAIGIIHAEYMNDLNRTDVARRVYISSPYFSHIFKKETGKSFTQYLNDYRMDKACMLLKSTSHNIYAVAKMVGFSNYPYFCSQFKKKFGQTCIQYRQNHFGVR